MPALLLKRGVIEHFHAVVKQCTPGDTLPQRPSTEAELLLYAIQGLAVSAMKEREVAVWLRDRKSLRLMRKCLLHPLEHVSGNAALCAAHIAKESERESLSSPKCRNIALSFV